MSVCTDRHHSGEVHFCKKCDENDSTMDYWKDECAKLENRVKRLQYALNHTGTSEAYNGEIYSE